MASTDRRAPRTSSTRRTSPRSRTDSRTTPVTSRYYRLVAVLGLLLPCVLPTKPAYADNVREGQWQLGYLDMGKVQQVSQGGGVTVAVIDNGINGNHPDLTGNVLQGLS